MRRTLLAVATLIIMVTISISAAFAARVHLIGTPTFDDLGTTLRVTGKLAGLGNQDVTITVLATGVGSATCTNRGGNQAPGQNRIPLTTAVSETISASEIENGNVIFAVTTAEPSQPTATEAGCPNNNWTATITDVEFTSATVTVVQAGEEVLEETFLL